MGAPAATVRGWLRRLRDRAGRMLQEATSEFGRLVAIIESPEGRDPSPPGPRGRRWEAELDVLIGLFGLAAALVPAPGG